MGTVANTAEPGRTTTSRVLAILASFTPGRTRMSLSDIRRHAGLRHATAHRLISELVQWGALERLSDGRYVVGLRLWELGTLSPRGIPVRAVAMPLMEDLCAATRQHVQLAVLDGTEAIVVERVSAQSAMPVVSQVGGRLPLHASAAGKALLAFAPRELFDVVTAAPLKAYTARTIVDVEALRSQLAECRRTRLATVREELSDGAFSVATPILDRNLNPVAALSVIGNEPEHIRTLAAAILTAGRGIARRLDSQEQT